MHITSRTILLMACCVAITGCTRRTITITSEPSGALCWLNGREVGRTPVTVDFLYYGTYDVQLVADGCEPLLTTGVANAPIWDHVPLDLISEITPPEKHSRIAWHFELSPPMDDAEHLLDRARELRGQVASVESPPAIAPVEPIASPTPR